MACALLQFKTWPRNVCVLFGKSEMVLLELITFHKCKLGTRLVIFLYAICEYISCSEESVAKALASWEVQQVTSWALQAEMFICNTGI